MLGRVLMMTIALMMAVTVAMAGNPAPAAAPAKEEAAPAKDAVTPAPAKEEAAPTPAPAASVEPEKPASPPEVIGKITGVAAGDQFLVNIAGVDSEVRLYAVDAPEEGQDLAEDAKKAAAAKVFNQEVTLILLTKDTVGKTVVTIKYGPSSANLGLELLDAGLAWWDQKNAPMAREEKAAGAKALAAKKGIFSKAAQLSPWDYRKAKKLPDYAYTVDLGRQKSAFEEEDPLDKLMKAKQSGEKKEEGTKSISAKGNEVYKGGFAVNISSLNIKDEDVKKLNPTQLLMDHFPQQAKDANGQAIGLQIPGIEQLPYASALGFQPGDVISSVNGVAITDPNQIMGLIPQFQGQGEFNVNIIRGGQPTTITIRP